MITEQSSYDKLIRERKDNEIIIDFMSDLEEWSLLYDKDGYKFYRNPWEKAKPSYNEKLEIDGEFYVGDCNFSFHNDWKWLMCVVKKIGESLYTIQNDIELQGLLNKYGFIYNTENNYCRLLVSPLIEETYPFVVEFISWYKSKY